MKGLLTIYPFILTLQVVNRYQVILFRLLFRAIDYVFATQRNNKEND